MRIRGRLAVFRRMDWKGRRLYYGRRIRRNLASLYHLPFYPIYYPISWFMGRRGYRFLVDRPGGRRIGHLATEPHFYVKARMINAIPEYRALMLGSKRRVANISLRDYWRKYITVISNPVIDVLMTPLTWMKPTRVELYPHDSVVFGSRGEEIRGWPAYDYVLGDYSKRFGNVPILELTDDHRRRGWDTLEKLGMPRDSWFVPLHVREGGYIRTPYPDPRNGTLDDFFDAISVITSKGGWVIRIGNPTMKPLPLVDGVIDYVFSDHRSDWMDIFLLAEGKFYLGSDSGPSVVSSVFGRPAAIVGGIPMGFGYVSPDGIHIRKLYREIATGRYLGFEEILMSELRDLHTLAEFQAAGLEWVDNTPDEIADLTREMISRMSREVQYTDEDENLQKRFRDLLLANPTEHTLGVNARVGRDYLRKHVGLF